MIDALPKSAGVYYFWGENNALLYVGKSKNIRTRVLSHFSSDFSAAREMKMCQQIRAITHDETAGELGALLLESLQIKQLQPIYNRRLRRQKQLYSLALSEKNSVLVPSIITANEWMAGQKSYGLFAAKAKATSALRDVAEKKRLCLQALGIERSMNRPCSAYQLKNAKVFVQVKNLPCNTMCAC